MTDLNQTLHHELLALNAREMVRPLDTALGQCVAQAGSQTEPEVQQWLEVLVQLVSARLGRGELKLGLQELSSEARTQLLHVGFDAVWLSHDNAKSGSPLVLHDNHIYLRRFWQLETDLNLQLQILEEEGRLRVITGPPGSGKTTRLKALIDERRSINPDLRVALAAPTGKAVHRLQQVLPGQANISTLHRLLGVGGQRSLAYLAKRSNAQPLPFDLVVVDEASMVGIELAQALLNSLLPHAELLLVGDANQLPSVEPGEVFASLCKRIAPAAIEHLQTQYRFKSDSAIGQLAAKLQSHHETAAVSVAELLSYTKAASDETVQCLRVESATDDRLVRQVADARRELIRLATHIRDRGPLLSSALAAKPLGHDLDLQAMLADLLHALDQFMVLTPFREGPLGSVALNKVFQKALHRLGLLESATAMPTGLPVICIENDYDLDLMNGSLGVVIGDMGLFDSSHGPRLVPLQQCPVLEPAFALTVHKAQGSEFTNLVFLLAESADNPLSVPLVYTAITRARESLTLVATAP
jgi:exodeoxyribonuclease V alpha subunit